MNPQAVELDLLGGDPGAVLLFLLLISFPVALLASWVVLHRYRRSVQRSMSGSSVRPENGGATPLAETSRGPDRDRGLGIVTIEGGRGTAAADPDSVARSRWSRRAPRRAAFVYGLAGVVHGAVAAGVLFLVYGAPLSRAGFLTVWLLLAWPVVPTVAVVAVAGRRAKYAGVVAILATGLLLAVIWEPGILVLWAGFMGIPTLVAAAIGHPRLRAVCPVLLAVTFVAFAGALVAVNLILSVVGLTSAIPAHWAVLGVIVASGAIGLAAWRVLAWFAGRYRAKRTSDQRLLIDVWWLLFTMWECVFGLVAAGAPGLLFLLAFFAYGAVLAFGLRPLRRAADSRKPLVLLLLRTFGSRRRSERLLAALSLQWRYVGNVDLIAGPDLAAANLEPHEFIDFLSGRLSRRFIDSAEALEDRLREADRAPDPDGRFRVNEFFCRDEVWRVALEALLGTSGAVLMDARGLSRQTKGLRHEIVTLVHRVPLHRAVLITDDTTNEGTLRESLEEGWATRRPDSPNTHGARITVFRMDEGSRLELTRLMGLLLNAAAGPVGPSA